MVKFEGKVEIFMGSELEEVWRRQRAAEETGVIRK